MSFRHKAAEVEPNKKKNGHDPNKKKNDHYKCKLVANYGCLFLRGDH